MRRLLLPYLLLLSSACTRPAVAPGVRDSGSFSVNGHRFNVPAKASYRSARSGDPDRLIVRIGKPDLVPGQGVLLLNYHKPAGAPESAYQATKLDYSYETTDLTSAIGYSTGLRGTLTKLRNGGYSGTFQGISTETRDTISGSFTNVLSLTVEQ